MLPRSRAYALVAGGDAVAVVLPLLAVGFTPIHVLYAGLLWLGLGGRFRGHDRFDLTVGGRVGGIAGRAGAVALLMAPLVGISGEAGSLLSAAALSLPSVTLGRALAYGVLRRLRSGADAATTLIVGAKRSAQDLARILLEKPNYYRTRLIGFVDDDEPDAPLPVPILGRTQDLPDIIDRYGVDRVIVASGNFDDEQVVRFLRSCENLRPDVYCLPRLFELGLPDAGGTNDDVFGYPLVHYQRHGLGGSTAGGKRAFDVAATTVLLALMAPIMALAAFGVRMSGPGPILFRQERIGRHERRFELMKFRSMQIHDDEGDVLWSADGDARVTRVGRILRATSIDELPQLFNVLRGDMSLVGPRPERPHFALRFSEEIPAYAERLRTHVGITGLAQVSGLRGDTSIADRARLDNLYIEQWSLWKDIVILCRTVSEVLSTVARSLHPAESGEIPEDGSDDSGCSAA